MSKLKVGLKIIFAMFFILGGVNHFVNPDFYIPMMPDYLPLHAELVFLSGVIEIVLGVALMVPRLQRQAAWALIAVLCAVFPANLNMYLNSENFPDVSETALLVRLPLQGLLILWAYAYTRSPRSSAK